MTHDSDVSHSGITRGFCVAAGLVFGLGAGFVQADSFNIRLGDDVVEANYEHFLGNLNNASVTGSYLRNSDRDIDLVSGGFFVHGARGELSGKLGIKGYYADMEDDDGYGAALGGEGRFRFSDVVSLVAGGYMGPSALSFSDVEGYSEWFVGADFSVFENAVISVGYRETEIDVDRSGDVEVEDGAYFALRLSF